MKLIAPRIEETGETLPLDFVIHQPVRHLKKEGEYFVCTDFRKPGSTFFRAIRELAFEYQGNQNAD